MKKTISEDIWFSETYEQITFDMSLEIRLFYRTLKELQKLQKNVILSTERYRANLNLSQNELIKRVELLETFNFGSPENLAEEVFILLRSLYISVNNIIDDIESLKRIKQHKKNIDWDDYKNFCNRKNGRNLQQHFHPEAFDKIWEEWENLRFTELVKKIRNEVFAHDLRRGIKTELAFGLFISLDIFQQFYETLKNTFKNLIWDDELVVKNLGKVDEIVRSIWMNRNE